MTTSAETVADALWGIARAIQALAETRNTPPTAENSPDREESGTADPARALVADVLYDHQLVESPAAPAECTCGWKWWGPGFSDDVAEWAAHTAAAILAALKERR